MSLHKATCQEANSFKEAKLDKHKDESRMVENRVAFPSVSDHMHTHPQKKGDRSFRTNT